MLLTYLQGFDVTRFHHHPHVVPNSQRVLRRLDISVDSLEEARLLDSGKIRNIHQLDLVAIIPKNILVLQNICETNQGPGLIVLSPEACFQPHAMAKFIKVGVARGIFFELNYSAAVFDTTSRR
jgi:hypothetical protein